MQNDAVAGAILGCAVGDALGLPYEGLSKRRGVRLYGEPERYRFLFGRGMISDDTEQTCLIAQALCRHPADPEAFARDFAWGLRRWLLGVPAGTGFATLKAILRLWMSIPPSRSGVFSAGNGAAMRSAVLGAAIDDLETLKKFVHASTVVTHTDPKAFEGAFAVAFAAWCAKRDTIQQREFFASLRTATEPDITDEWEDLLIQTAQSLAAGESTETFATQIGCGQGVSGYVYRTVPVALHAWLSFPHDYRQAVQTVIRCGGDADTTAAIVGALVGCSVGCKGIPLEWRAGLWEFPRSAEWMEHLASATRQASTTGKPTVPPRTTPFLGLVRNLIFLFTVLFHGFRRLFPPY
jgi:ADP-ribosyl-[dinitrogen reductase] hydrolase